MERNTLYLRTDRAIIGAVIRLLKEKPFEKITVQNILDETPVTRATFYAHFHDKYEVAERMQEMYIQLLRDIPVELEELDRAQHPAWIRKSLLRHGDLIRALLRIHTDRVDVRMVTAEIHKRLYLSHADADSTEAEADIYAQTMTALQMAYLSGDARALEDENYYDKVMVKVFLRILNLDSDAELRRQIIKKLPGSKE